MLIYNTTYHVDIAEEDNFLIWVKEVFIPEVIQQEVLQNPRICKILSHSQPDQVNYALQWEVESAALLHKWHLEYGDYAKKEVTKIFKVKVLSFDTLMKVI